MAEFSARSLEKLESVHQDLQTVFKEVVRHFDCTVVSGMRTQEEQQALYAKGRTVDGVIITYKDGIERRSRHQDGLAVDVVPYPTMYTDEYKMIHFGWFVKGVAATLKRYGQIENDIDWGGDWDWKDLPHFQIKT